MFSLTLIHCFGSEKKKLLHLFLFRTFSLCFTVRVLAGIQSSIKGKIGTYVGCSVRCEEGISCVGRVEDRFLKGQTQTGEDPVGGGGRGEEPPPHSSLSTKYLERL